MSRISFQLTYSREELPGRGVKADKTSLAEKSLAILYVSAIF